MKFKKYLLEELKKKGVERIFGVPGRENEEIQFNEVEGLDFITTRVEFTAAVAGDVSGRITNKLQVVFSTMGPGATNLTTGIASAMLNKSPVLYLTSQLESDDKYYNVTHQCVDQTSIFKPITKYSVEISSPKEIVSELNKAIDIALTEPRGPVHIAIPTDFFNAEISISDCLERERYDLLDCKKDNQSMVDKAEVDEVRKMLVNSSKPVCLLGSEVCRAECFDEVLKFCHSWNVPFITSANVKGISPMFEDELNLGSASCYMEGIMGYPALDKIFNETDLVVLIGYQYVDDLLPKMWQRGNDKKVCTINFQHSSLLERIINPNLAIYGNLSDIIDNLKNENLTNKKQDRNFSELKYYLKNQKPSSTKDFMNPYEVVSVINEFMNNAILVTDIGYYRHHAIIYTDAKSPFSFISDTGISSFGTGLPSAIAAKINYPEKNIFLVCGDGGFHSGSGDLATLVKYNLPIVIIVLDNSRFKLIDLYQKKKVPVNECNSEITGLSNVDFPLLAKANGCFGESAKSAEELRKHILNWDRTKPLLIEIPVEYTDTFEVSF